MRVKPAPPPPPATRSRPLRLLILVTGLFMFLVFGALAGHRIIQHRAVHAAFRAYHEAAAIPDPAKCLEITGPLTRAWAERMVAAARTDTWQQLHRRPLSEAVAVLQLRMRYNARELDAMAADDALKLFLSKLEARTASTMVLSQVKIDGDRVFARARIPKEGKRDSWSIVGDDEFLTRADGQWCVNWHLLEAAILDQFTNLPATQRREILADGFEKESGKPFDPKLFDGPRP